jgi:hypothetical protein
MKVHAINLWFAIGGPGSFVYRAQCLMGGSEGQYMYKKFYRPWVTKPQ